MSRIVYFRELTPEVYPLWLECNTQLDPVTGCRLYVGSLDTGTGYARRWRRGRKMVASRWVYECLKGQLPAGLEVDHTCRRRGCVWIEHLEAVTHAENVRRAVPYRRKTRREL